MRGLSPRFIEDLEIKESDSGLLSPILKEVNEDRDLILEIRDDYFNIYYKGQSLLKLARSKGVYRGEMNDKFIPEGYDKIKTFATTHDVSRLINVLPLIKDKISKLFSGGMEIEFEQMIIRANNHEPNIIPDYQIIDRQVVISEISGQTYIKDLTRMRFLKLDLTGIYLEPRKWFRKEKAPLTIFEIKFGEKDIPGLADQLACYFDILNKNEYLTYLCEESEKIKEQKVRLNILGSFPYSKQGRLRQLGKLKISRDPNDVKFVVILVDFPPRSELFDREIDKMKAQKASFYNRIHLFRTGFALRNENVKPISEILPK